MSIHYRDDARVSARELASLFDSAGLRRPTGDLDRLGRMIENADLFVTAWDGARLVGVARALTDFCYCCHLSDLAVDKEYQHRGIGGELIRLVREAIGGGTSLILLAAPEAMNYYPKVGMEPIQNGWIIKRTG